MFFDINLLTKVADEDQEMDKIRIESVYYGCDNVSAAGAPAPLADDLSSVRCREGSECCRFRRMLQTWPKSKPKAAIYFLTQANARTLQARDMISSLYRHFNDEYRYPVIIFYTGDISNATNMILSGVRTRELIFMQEIEFQIPEVYPNKEKNRCPGSLGYRHMCRFHANTVYTHPILQGLEYAWRLDDDSFFLGPTLHYDVFAFMKRHNLLYGYIKVRPEAAVCMPGLWELTGNYTNKHNIIPTFFNSWMKGDAFYNNFEISKMSFWRSAKYRRFVKAIDENGGIFRYRWGDAPIKTLALSLFVEPAQIHRFSTLGYSHQNIRQIGVDVVPREPVLLSKSPLVNKTMRLKSKHWQSYWYVYRYLTCI